MMSIKCRVYINIFSSINKYIVYFVILVIAIQLKEIMLPYCNAFTIKNIFETFIKKSHSLSFINDRKMSRLFCEFIMPGNIQWTWHKNDKR